VAHFDLFVIGGGSGGIACARRAASHGARVALAEAGRLGGTCVIRGCVPKKLMHYAARFGAQRGLLAAYGWRGVPAELDFAALLENRDREVARLEGVYENMLASAGVRLFRARARIGGDGTPPHEVIVGGESHRADQLLIAVGGRPSRPQLAGIEHTVTSDFVLEGRYPLPREVVIVGAGYIGVELASIFNGLGSRVRLLYRRELPLRGFEEELRLEMAEALARSGIDLVPETHVRAIREEGARRLVDTDRGTLAADLVVYATGRHPIPNTRGLGLEEIGVRMKQDGTIYVNAGYGTNVPGIHAVGDCADHAGHGMDASQHDLTPVAIAEGRALADRLFGGITRHVNYETIPTAIFSIPQAASAGYTEEGARSLGFEVEVYKTRFRPMLYTLPEVAERSFMKMIVDRADGRVLGVHMVGDDAAEILQGFAVAMTAGARKEDLDATVGLHPTAAEELVTMYQPAA